MYDSDDYFSNDISNEYWDDVYYDETHPDYSSNSGPRYGGRRNDSHSSWFWAFVVVMIFAYIAPGISGWAFIVTLIIVALAKKCG